MPNIWTHPAEGKNRFRLVADPFLATSGLPFANVLPAECIQQAFARHDALFAQGPDGVFSTQLTLWAFLAQVLQDGKGAACAAAVSQIGTYLQQTCGATPRADTGDYCRARAKLSLDALAELTRHVAAQLQQQAPDAWRWHGRDAKLVDGFTFTMPDTPANQHAFPQHAAQQTGVGLPIARAVTVLNLATAAIHDLAVGPYQGKQTGENALLRSILDSFQNGDLVVFDRYYGSFMMIALLQLRGADVCTRLHARRPCHFRRGRSLGEADHRITWTRPPRPHWMSPQQYAQIPETLTLRELQFEITGPGKRTETITVVTTLTDPLAYPKADIADLYGYRWNVELDIRHIKQTLGLDHARCKSPHMVRRELWVTLLAYNLIRKVIATAAAVHGKPPRHLGFTRACQRILASWMLWATDACRDARAQIDWLLSQIAANEVANRPGRIEPRVLKRRRHRYPLMTRSRAQLRRELA
jgi:putative transposase